MELVLLGDPVEHSRSPALHSAALAAAGIPGRYRVRTVDLPGMLAAAEELRKGILHGANITMPHKRLAAELADELTPWASRAGSVNTWVVRNGLLLGTSTDGDGIKFAWQTQGLPTTPPVLILGNGGAAAAALIALEDRELFISGRRPDRVGELIERLGVRCVLVPWGTPVEGAVVVNATPLGMHGERLPDGIVGQGAGLLDMTYGPAPTAAVREAERAGLPHASGLDMLIGQAMASFALWTGVRPDESVLRAALD